MNKKIINILAIILIIGLAIVIIIGIISRPKTSLPADNSYFPEQLSTFDKYVEENYPELPVKKEIPYFSSDEYFDYRIMPSFETPAKFDVILNPRFTDVNTIDSAFPVSQTAILQWFANHQTLISNISIDWYVEYNQQKILVDQTNPDA